MSTGLRQIEEQSKFRKYFCGRVWEEDHKGRGNEKEKKGADEIEFDESHYYRGKRITGQDGQALMRKSPGWWVCSGSFTGTIGRASNALSHDSVSETDRVTSLM
ncbi:hypothetical protein OUZ56_001849 [Daphnia magna]|uniref:Uncharacterized protein n=1 Tax=Daphnia magna TaxID=35525 RepID=A0ABR0A4C0_9CRUS|nr:hypothetical protein OUZ56_001849 [Daphnia magna]